MTKPPDLPLSGEIRPPQWKGMDDFAAGIDGNRLPSTNSLAGRTLRIRPDTGDELELAFGSGDQVDWRQGGRSGSDWYENIEMRPGLHYLSVTHQDDPRAAEVIIADESTGRTLTVAGRIADQPTPGRPRVSQTFTTGVLAGATVRGPVPGPSRDLVGWRALYRYSPNHLYEHVYLSSERYCWQCIVGEQCGHGDVDLASTWSLGENLYVFTFREFLIPVAATWLYDLDAMRTTGTFLGLGADGTARCAPGGAFITELGRVSYPDEQPV
ncbi:MAG: molybdenum cofactor biosynthesis F family protein [Jatrophihabitantaceae bacterium]